MNIDKVTRYITSDEKEFTSKDEAIEHIKILKAASFMYKFRWNEGIFDGDEIKEIRLEFNRIWSE